MRWHLVVARLMQRQECLLGLADRIVDMDDLFAGIVKT